eukprot:scaffold111840_cov50-Prasinocladus_malaysianus.AAC.1
MASTHVIQCPWERCPRCDAELRIRNCSGRGHRGRAYARNGRPLRVVTPCGIFYGIEVVKRCTTCNSNYHHNYEERIEVVDGRRRTRRYKPSLYTTYAIEGPTSFKRDVAHHIHLSSLDKYIGDYAFMHAKHGAKDVQDAWCWYKLLGVRCGPTANPRGMSHLRAPDMLDRLLRESNQGAIDRPEDAFPFLHHRCRRLGCHGPCPEDASGNDDVGEEYDCIVVDGIATLCGHRCADHACTNTPRNYRVRFCEEHEFLEDRCAASLGDGAFCEEQSRAGHMTCQAHADIERQYGGAIPYHFIRPRNLGESQHAWRANFNNYWRERKKHRFSRAFQFGFWFAVRPCGVILACKPMVEHESPRDLLQWLNNLFPTDATRPCYVIYDRACQVWRTLQPGNTNAGWAETWGDPRVVMWLVDRFHYKGHSRDDEVCRLNCSPHSHNLRGLVYVVETEAIPDEAEINPQLRADFGRTAHIPDPLHDPPQGQERRVVSAREVVRRVDGVRTRMILMDMVNTSIAESVFANMHKYGSCMRKMTGPRSTFFLRCVSISHAELTTASLSSGGMNPVPLHVTFPAGTLPSASPFQVDA